MKKHPQVKHPNFFLVEEKKLNDKLLDFVSDHVLPSTLLADVALVVPLLAIPAPNSVKLTLGVISGSWIQWWALHILRRGDIQSDAKQAAKAEADHRALTHIANVVDEIRGKL